MISREALLATKNEIVIAAFSGEKALAIPCGTAACGDVMSRLKHYTRALASGYLLLAVNTAFTLASIPLALHYLPRAGLGLWVVTTQVAGYLALLDFGLSGALARLLVDYKDRRDAESYGSMVQTGLFASGAQGALLGVVAVALFFVPGTVPGLAAAEQMNFRWLMLGQCLLLALGFAGRVFTSLLWAHQRTDLGNAAQIVGFAVNFTVLWLAFRADVGVFSLLWGQFAGLVVGIGLSAVACRREKLLPQRGHWGRADWTRFREVFGFGKEVFLFTLGSQMINTSQTLVLAPVLGFDAAGVWLVCTRTYLLVCQMVWRIMDFSTTPLAEMYARGERALMLRRFRSVTVLTGVVAVVGAVLFAACNQRFVTVWTHGAVSWPAGNDALLGVWCVIMALQRCHTGVLGATKQFRTLKLVYFLEGAVFACTALWSAPRWGFPAMILSSIVATLTLSFLHGLWRTKTDFDLAWAEMLRWLAPAARTAFVLVPLGALVWWLTTGLRPILGLFITGTLLSVAGFWLALRLGLDDEMREKVGDQLPSWLRPWLDAPSGQPAARA
jgi:Polysaccharide biosynthesis protein